MRRDARGRFIGAAVMWPGLSVAALLALQNCRRLGRYMKQPHHILGRRLTPLALIVPGSNGRVMR